MCLWIVSLIGAILKGIWSTICGIFGWDSTVMKRVAVFVTFILTVPLVWAAVTFGYVLMVEEWRLIEVSSREGANAMGVAFMIAHAAPPAPSWPHAPHNAGPGVFPPVMAGQRTQSTRYRIAAAR